MNTDISERIGRCYSICKESAIAVKLRVVHKLFQTKVYMKRKGGTVILANESPFIIHGGNETKEKAA